MTDLWPPALHPRDIGIHYRARNLSGGAATNGYEQVVMSPAGLWVVEYGRVRIASAAIAQLWNGLATRWEGRLNPILVPFCLGPRPYAGGAAAAPIMLPHDDDTFFDDDTGYTQFAIDATVATAAALRATTISIDVTNGGALAIGQYFGIGDRAYQIRSIDSVAATVTTVGIRPPLRAAAPAGTAINFDRPVCKMRLETDDAMAVTLELFRHASPTVRFVEELR